MEIEKAVLLSSGGMDSTVMAFWLERNGVDFIPLFLNYGQHCAAKELETLKKVLPNGFSDKIEVVDISDIYKYSSSNFIREANLWETQITANDLYIPYRNILLLTIGASFAQTLNRPNLYSAFINSNHAKEIDCSKQFFDNLENILESYGSVKIKMPFIELSKYDVAKLGLELNASIGKTFSCQASSQIPCGACPNCVDRLEALKKLELE